MPLYSLPTRKEEGSQSLGEGPGHSCQVELMSVAPGGYECILVLLDTYSDLDFTYLMVEANVQNSIKGQK